jgi:hypothetical protein
MKTHQEIVAEARQIEEAGRQFWTEHLPEGGVIRAAESPGAAGPTRVVFHFPPTRVTRHHPPGAEEPRTRLTWRWIEVGGNERRYDLCQEWAEMSAAGRTVDQAEAFVELQSESAEEVLEEGHERALEERLTESLAPYLNRLEADGFAEANEPALTQAIEQIVESGALAPGARLRAKADIIALLEGRLEPGEFITAAIARHSLRENETLAARQGERLVIDPL